MASSIFPSGPFGTYNTLILAPNASHTVVRAEISNPPINLLNAALLLDLHALLTALQSAPDAARPKVVIFSSTNPTYFVAHYDLHIVSANHPLPASTPPGLTGAEVGDVYVQVVRLLVSLPTIFIGEITGQAFGAGNELLVQMDMRFAGPKARLGALEVGLGLLAGNGELQFMTKLIGRGRALEYLLSSGTVDAAEADRIGWVNKSFQTNEALREYVQRLAERIATFPAAALAATKAGVNEQNVSEEVLGRDIGRFVELAGRPEAQRAVDRFFEMGGNEKDGEVERGLNENLVELWR